MRNYLKKSISKPLLFFVVIAVCIFIIFSISFSIKKTLEESKLKIEQQLSKYLKHNTTIERITYIPPNLLILKEICVNYPKENIHFPPLSVKSIKIVFSLNQLLEKKVIAARRVVFVNPQVDYFKYHLFFKENIFNPFTP